MGDICSERQFLSAYFDGEVPSPWKEKMESHIAGCPQCARRLEKYRRISRAAAGDIFTGPAMEAVKERVWRKLEQRTGMADGMADGSLVYSTAVWRRRVAVPLPAAAAAIVLFVALAVVMALKITGSAENSGMILASETEFDAPGIVPASDMESVLQYLGSRDNGEIIIVRLPESRNFVNYGEPAIIKAADYSRQMPGRQMSGRNMPEWRKP